MKIYLFMASVEAIGLFLLLCGIFHMTISEIGRLASLGYIVGLGALIFAAMLVLETNTKNRS